MKRLLIVISACCFLMADPDPVGNWKLSGLKVDYLHITREEANVVLTDAYDFGVTVPVASIPEGVLFQRFTNGPFTLPIIDAAQLNLNVNLYPDGTGAIAEGSFYPDIDLIEGTCITSPQIFPVTDTFIWEVGSESTFAPVNIIGIPGLNDLAGSQAWGFGVDQSSTFDAFSSTAIPEALPVGSSMVALTDGTVLAASCQTAIIGAACGAAGFDPASQLNECLAALAAAGQYVGDGSGVVEQQVVACEMDTNPAYGGTYAGSANWGGAGWLHGSGNSGYFHTDQGNSQMGQDLEVDFLLEWNGIDGPNTGSGYGDDPDVDENGDGSAFDRVFGLPYITATYTHAGCPLAPGLDAPIAGDLTGLVSGLVEGLCYEQVVDGITAQCDAADLDGDGAGSPGEAVTGLCYDASQSAEFAGACAYYGAAAALTATCLQLGFSEEICAAAAEQGIGGVEAYCQYITGGATCEQAGIDQCTVLTNPEFALGLCGTLAGSLVTSETCEEWAGSFDTDFLDEQAAALTGATCPQTGAGAEAACISGVDFANDMYLMDLSLDTWGYFLTYNAASVQQYLAAGYTLEDIAGFAPGLFADDSATSFDPSCYADGDPSDCGGKLLMHYEPLCINEIEARQIVAEFVDLDDLCEASGDVNGDGVTNVVDIVRIVTHVLGGDQLGGVGGCEADINGDGVINVVDIVQLVNIILSSRSTGHTDATEANVSIDNNQVVIESNGYIGGIDMIVAFSGTDLVLEFGNNDVADYVVNDDNTARVIMASATGIKEAFTVKSGVITSIEDVTLVTSNGEGYAELDNVGLESPSAFRVGTAYPNPFNPTTQLSLVLDTRADISVKVYNIMGQLVDVIAEGSYSPNQYNWTWNAENLASGVYLVRTQVGSHVDTQKIMLLK